LNLTFSPNSKWLAFRGDLETDGVTNIYIVDATGTIPGPAIRLNRLTTNADVLTADGDVAWKRSGDGIFYESDEGVNDIDEVWFVDLRGPMPSTPRRIHNPVITSADVDLFVVQP
jgi:Tol biopolymer transport system component